MIIILRDDEEKEEEINPLLNHIHALPKRGTTVIDIGIPKAEDEKENVDEKSVFFCCHFVADEHPLWFCGSFVASRILVFLMLMLKWTLMVFAAACALSIVATSIFLSISIIYRLIRMSCQCELNEG